MNKKKFISLLTVFTIILVTVTFSNETTSYATKSSDQIKDEIEELENKKDDISDQKGDVISEKNETEKAIEENIAEQERINGQIIELDQKLTETQEKIDVKEGEITQTEQEIEVLNGNIEKLQGRIAERNELLKNRLRSLQQNGGTVSYLEVMLGAKDFGDFLNRSNAVSTIMDQDKKIMEQQRIEKQELEATKVEVEEKKATLIEQKDSLLALQDELDTQRAQKASLIAQLQIEEEELHKHQMSLKEEAELLAAQEAAFAALIRKRNAEYEAAKEEERLAELAQQAGSSGFMRPAAGWITSEFEQRWGEFHYGLDIAKSGKVPIYAANSGLVSKSYLSGSYGNAVFIAHDVGGTMYTTVYAHMRNRLVSTGEWVNKGQIIGYMGNTGWSTGQHLHFELHNGPWTADKGNAINPRKLINF